MNEKIRELLYRSLDEELTAGERRTLDDALAASESLRAEREAAMELRGALAGDPQWHFEPFFAQRVMQRIAQTPALEDMAGALASALIRLFRPVAAVTVAVLILLAGWNVVATGKVAPTNDDAVSAEHVLETPVDALLEESP